MIRVFLLIDVYEPSAETSAAGSINTAMRSVVPQVVDFGNSFKLGGNLGTLK